MCVIYFLLCRDFINGGGIEFKVNFDEDSEVPEELSYKPNLVSDYLNPAMLVDEDTYDESQPFELIGKKMEPVTPDNKVRKRIIREGNGLIVPDLSQVTVDYNSYFEYNDQPYDSTYIRKKPFTFRLNFGETIPGLDKGVSTMKPNEKAQFLIHPDYAYGKLGCPPRIPANAFVLFEVELRTFSDSGATVNYQSLNEKEQTTFTEIYKYSSGLCAKANEFFKKHNYKTAMREYNIAISKLEFCELPTYEDQEQQHKLLLRLYINLAITYNMLNQPGKCCTSCNKIYYITKGTTLQIPAKVYFHNARALIKLSNFHMAKKRLMQAKSMEPNNPEIYEEFKVLEAAQKKAQEIERTLAQAFLQTNINFKETKKSVSDEFKKAIEDVCNDMMNDKVEDNYKLPSKLNVDEKRCVERIAREYRLQYKEDGSDVYIFKAKETEGNDDEEEEEKF